MASSRPASSRPSTVSELRALNEDVRLRRRQRELALARERERSFSFAESSTSSMHVFPSFSDDAASEEDDEASSQSPSEAPKYRCPTCRESHADRPDVALRPVFLDTPAPKPRCPVCLEDEYDGPPMNLPCGHVLCKGCARLMGFQARPSEVVQELLERGPYSRDDVEAVVAAFPGEGADVLEEYLWFNTNRTGGRIFGPTAGEGGAVGTGQQRRMRSTGYEDEAVVVGNQALRSGSRSGGREDRGEGSSSARAGGTARASASISGGRSGGWSESRWNDWTSGGWSESRWNDWTSGGWSESHWNDWTWGGWNESRSRGARSSGGGWNSGG